MNHEDKPWLKPLELLIRLRTVWLSLIILSTLLVIAVLFAMRVREPKWTPFMRGEALAKNLGCFACHGGIHGMDVVPNPHSDLGIIPPLNAKGPLMFYVQSEEEIRQWILDGAPPRMSKLRADLKDKSLVQMPGYRGFISESNLNDLVAYIKGVAVNLGSMPRKVEIGYRVAYRLGCFGCHGTMGLGGVSNPGSFKGYIPPWDGADYRELVRSKAELKEWILNGMIRRFEKDPTAKYFTSLQVIKMPAYKGQLKPGELEAIMNYIKWLRLPPNRKTSPAVNIVTNANWRQSRVERGEWLYKATGCSSCHGIAGLGGIENPNASGQLVPSLNDLAERIGLSDKTQAHAVVSTIEQGLDVAIQQSKAEFEDYGTVQRIYGEMRELILVGGKANPIDKNLPDPPIHMPGWSERLGADGSPASREDVDSIMAYLIALQEWEE